MKMVGRSHRILKIVILAFIFSPFVNAEEGGEDDGCQGIQQYVLENSIDGWLVRSQVTKTVPLLYTNFSVNGWYVGVPLRIVDLDHNGVFEVVYPYEVARPRHVRTKLYVLDHISRSKAQDLIEKKHRSKHYAPLMGRLKQYTWDMTNDIGDLQPLDFPLQEVLQQDFSVDGRYRINITARDGKNYFLIEELEGKRISLVSVRDLERQSYQYICGFDLLVQGGKRG